ncbi:DNA cytosine methyltransferase [Erwinia tracheiphila]
MDGFATLPALQPRREQRGQLDERHLAPTFMRLVTQCRPPVLFGEQVAAAISKHWLDDLFTELERENYACGAAVLPACSVGAPHKRDRLYFGARLLADGVGVGSFGRGISKKRTGENKRYQEGIRPFKKFGVEGLCPVDHLADTYNTRSQGWERVCERTDQQPAGASGLAGSVAESLRTEWHGERLHRPGESHGTESSWASAELTGRCHPGKSTNPHHSFWSDADWLGCRDGRFRPVESGTFPLANGISARVGRLRGYGNAIVPQVAAQFIIAFMAACNA